MFTVFLSGIRGDFYLSSFCLPRFSKYFAIGVLLLLKKKIARLIFICLGQTPALLLAGSVDGQTHHGRTNSPWKDNLTWQRAAKDLHPHADAPVVKPGLRVDADVAGHHGDGQLVENRDLLFTVSFKYLFMHEGGKENLLELDHQGIKGSVIHSFHKEYHMRVGHRGEKRAELGLDHALRKPPSCRGRG